MEGQLLIGVPDLFNSLVPEADYQLAHNISFDEKIIGAGFDEEHNAAADIKATVKCFWELERRGIL